MATEKTTDQASPMRIRVSEQALSILDDAAKRNGRSRNAEATARLEKSLLGESAYPAERALVAFVSELTASVGGLVGLFGPEFRGGELGTLKGALCALLDGLGAESDEKVTALGAGIGKRFISDARLAMTKVSANRTAWEETLAEAAEAWGLKSQ